MEPLLSQKFTNETNKLDEGELLERVRLERRRWNDTIWNTIHIFYLLAKDDKKRNVEIVSEFGGWLICCEGTYR